MEQQDMQVMAEQAAAVADQVQAVLVAPVLAEAVMLLADVEVMVAQAAPGVREDLEEVAHLVYTLMAAPELLKIVLLLPAPAGLVERVHPGIRVRQRPVTRTQVPARADVMGDAVVQVVQVVQAVPVVRASRAPQVIAWLLPMWVPHLQQPAVQFLPMEL
jgi:hypothetical protein